MWCGIRRCRLMASRTNALICKIHFATILATDYLTSYLDTACGTDRGFFAYLMSAFRTFYQHLIFLNFIVGSSDYCSFIQADADYGYRQII